MGIQIASNFSYAGKLPNFERDKFDTLADMLAFPESSLDDGHISFNVELGASYQYKSTNEVDATLGKWRKIGGSDVQYFTEDEFNALFTQAAADPIP